MVTFACVWVQGNVPYDAEYVKRLRSGVERLYAGKHRFVCLTDRPRELLGVETVTIRPTPGIPGWWSKIEFFNPKNGLEGRVVCLDLDVLPVYDLESVVDYDSSFAMVPDSGSFQGRGNLKVVKRYNTSVMVFDAGPRVHMLHKLWKPDVARRLWGDQDYVGQMLPNEDVMPLMWFPRLSELTISPEATGLDAVAFLREREARVVLSKKPKNREAAESMPWFRDLWQ